MHIPLSTYRIQFTSKFNFNDAKKIVKYLSEFGINDLYASPILQARTGSTHGYDVVEPTKINPELGSEKEFYELAENIKQNKLGWLQDIVPNHMAYSHQNKMLIDLFENGPASRFYNFFDIEWSHPHESVRGRILAPFLGKFYPEVLECGELILKYDEEGFSINYYETKLPLRMESYVEILSFRLKKLINKLGKNDTDAIKFMGVLYILKTLSSVEEIDERYSQIKFLKALLWELYSSNDEIKIFINENLKIYNGEKNNPESLNLLDNLLANQYYRLAFWKVANEEINYRRFFNVNELISLKIEYEEVFGRVHSLIFRLLKEEAINGLRIDHVDGLYDPTKYLYNLRDRAKNSYIVVEKILEFDEELPKDWPIHGTTGYEFMNFLNGIFCKHDNEKSFSGIYQRFIKYNTPYERIVLDKKRLFIQTRMAGEVERLSYIIESISSKDRYGIDITMHGLKKALEELLTYFPVYRTYVNGTKIYERDKKYLDYIIKKVSEHNPRLTNEFNYICDLLKQNFKDHFTEEQKERALDFVMKFQQLTGPLMAKGFEDTALYIYNRFISLNEVGGSPDKFGITLREFHNFNKKRMKYWKHTLNSTSTHDTKRGEDVRARLNVISEMPREWSDKVRLWNKFNQPLKKNVRGIDVPDRNDEYFLYQTLVGAYPLLDEEHETFIQRVKEYIQKSVREAKVFSAWISPNIDYENAYFEFIENILRKDDENQFFKDFFEFQKRILHYGIFNSISQTLVKYTSPGVPDTYQGSELYNFSLVDPDNRRPVDFELREKYLSEMKNISNRQNYFAEILKSKDDGRIKMFVSHFSLLARNEFPQIFNEGKYTPLQIEGKFKENIIAYARNFENQYCIIVAPRFLTKIIKETELPLGEIWEDTKIKIPLEISSLENYFTKEKITAKENIFVKDILKELPVALLIA